MRTRLAGSERLRALMTVMVVGLGSAGAAEPPGPVPAANGPMARFVASPEDQARLDATRAVLEEETGYEFLSEPLRGVTEQLEDKHDVQIELDVKTLETLGLTEETEITGRLRKLPLKTGLDLLLKPLGLAWSLKPGYILITGEDARDRDLLLRVYLVADLVAAPDGGSAAMTADDLVATLTAQVDPAVWSEAGGPCSLRALGRGDVLTVAAPWPVHEAIEHFLTTVRAVRRETPAATVTGPPAQLRGPTSPPPIAIPTR